jgi:hypothetical protein
VGNAPPIEVASQSEPFANPVAKPRLNQSLEWMAQSATIAKSFLLTGRLYWLLGRVYLSDLSRQPSSNFWKYAVADPTVPNFSCSAIALPMSLIGVSFQV